MPTQVINIKQAPAGWKDDPHYVYIGRPSPWGNPFVIGPHGDRQQVIDQYVGWAKQHLTRTQVAALAGKTLVCFCHPLPCHGHVLARWADRYGGSD